ncbi:FAD-dependent monooxygenase [Streptomyces cinnabarinus]|uniref:FAD-dependent monooxygenase n=1 Tax=Streptomyces cinnabarinus TaxID=67287 RepID=A0ABY7KA49_9ACTN|nr:FAD-dependent monooxygenase [Streptomyces cinnabarinus]WAZ20002.1 FAD-dependent monooxygenase [Streptomyces cinnabarinus]
MSTKPSHGAVIGGGLAGMLTARALRRHLDRVTVIDRDELPDGPEPRKGVPQARHAHLLWSGGARIVESLLPGTVERLRAAGAHRIGVQSDMVNMSPYGWQRRFPETQFLIAVGRPLLDWTVRDQVLADPAITVLARTEVHELRGTEGHLDGLSVRGLDSGAVTELDAELVVDAGGRGSRLRQWVAPLGVPEPEEDVVDSGITYSTRIYHAPERAAARFPMVSVYADYRAGEPGRSGLILPIENGRWIVTLSGTRGGEPPTDEAGFTAFAESLRHPLVGQVLATAEPAGPVRGSRSTANRRIHYDRLDRWPDNLIVLGDALAAFNPIYGHGMSSAARAVAVLDRTLRRHRGTPGLAVTAMRAIAAAIDDPWILAASQDVFYPDCRVEAKDPRLSEDLHSRQDFSERVGTVGLSDPVVSAASAGVTTLAAPVASLQSPAVLNALRTGPAQPPLSDPPLTDEEWALLR